MKNVRTLILITFLTIPLVSFADIDVVQPLIFGTLVVVNNDTQGTYVIDRYGNTTISNHFGILTSPQIGIFRLTNFGPFERKSISVVAVASEMNPGTAYEETFTLSLTDYDDSVVIDADGEALIRVGGTITTSGLGSTNYVTSPYESLIRITVNL